MESNLINKRVQILPIHFGQNSLYRVGYEGILLESTDQYYKLKTEYNKKSIGFNGYEVKELYIKKEYVFAIHEIVE